MLHKHLPFCKVKIIFKIFNQLKTCNSFKDVAKFGLLRAEAAMLDILVKPLGT